MVMIALDAIKLSTANLHHVVHKIFKQLTNHIVLILIQILMNLDPSLGRPLRRRTTNLLLGIIGVMIDTEPINLVLNGIFSVLDHVAETWGKYGEYPIEYKVYWFCVYHTPSIQ